MAEVKWTTPAFRQIEQLPASLAFTIIDRVDLLGSFPEMGARLTSRSKTLTNCRQLIIDRSYRVIYEVEEVGLRQTVFILAVQHCRQRLPSARELKRRIADQEPNADE